MLHRQREGEALHADIIVVLLDVVPHFEWFVGVEAVGLCLCAHSSNTIGDICDISRFGLLGLGHRCFGSPCRAPCSCRHDVFVFVKIVLANFSDVVVTVKLDVRPVFQLENFRIEVLVVLAWVNLSLIKIRKK